jgi:hypothetical protein
MIDGYQKAFDEGYRQLLRRRRGQEQVFLHVKFLRDGRIISERILEEKYACKAMSAWTARGEEFTVRNQPVEFSRFGVEAGLQRRRAFRVEAVRRFAA